MRDFYRGPGAKYKNAFENWKTPVPGAQGEFTETWESGMTEYKYLSRHNRQTRLMINKESLQDEHCYDLFMELTYQNPDLLILDYEEIKSKLLRLGALLEESSILGMPGVFKSGTLDIEYDSVDATFTFSLNSFSGFDRLSFVYKVCLK